MTSLLRHRPLLRRIMAGPIAVRRALIGWRERPREVCLERIGEIIKENVVFEAAEFGGIFSINPRSHLLRRFLRNGCYEPNICRLFLAHIHSQDDVIDVGANVGFYTVAGAKHLTIGRLLAAEPTAEAFSRLSENVRRNNVADRVILFKGMIGAAKGQGYIHFVPGLEEYSAMGAPEHVEVRGKEVRTELVPIERIDDLVALHSLRPAVLKIDVEGAEFSVLSGAQNTIATYRPVVISEVWQRPTKAIGHSVDEIARIFKDLDYIARDPNDPLAEPDMKAVGEIICIPREKFDPSLLTL